MNTKTPDEIRNERRDAFNAKYQAADTFSKNLYPMSISVIAQSGGIVLQRSVDNKTGKEHFKLFWDGECLSTMYSEKEARAVFQDFCPKKKKKAKG